MGKQQPDVDKVTALLGMEDWEDDQTATTVASTVADSDSEEEEELDPEAAFEEENKYREPPAEPLYGGKGKNNKYVRMPDLRPGQEQEDKVSKASVARRVQGKESRHEESAVKAPVLTPEQTEKDTQARSRGKNPRRQWEDPCHCSSAHVAIEQRAKDPCEQRAQDPCHCYDASVAADEQRAQDPCKQRAQDPCRVLAQQRVECSEEQRIEHPRHWLEVPANNKKAQEDVAKRRALAKELMGEDAQKPVKIRGLMCPRLRALQHPAAPLLKEYASQGCPVDVGRDWSPEELQAAVDKGPHVSALELDAIEQIQKEAKEKERQGFAKIYTWEWLKKNLHKHPQLKLSPLAMIPHKSRKYRAILDLSYQLLVAGYLLPSVNDATVDCAPEEAISQIGTVLPRIIEALANIDTSKGPVSIMKVDLTDGFWRVIAKEGAEWNFAYVLPNLPGKTIEIAVPAALQMGWASSPPFFCAASETARDVCEQLVHEPVGTLPRHPLEDLTMPVREMLPQLKTAREGKTFLHMLEVFVDDFIQLAQTTEEGALRHCSRAVLHGIHSVFPPPKVTGHNGEDPVSIKRF